ncbi:PREDICTED: uncharacterized protein LOC105359382 [Ceratosolen solmsi marchali]|uniref:Uncharacterized protein LOC105359382 n=1 Tax=Ceratosolen solmsi marchali TaxID=326594 RepID=A0AAJ6VL76_9HYME|nr:PREDICTED: uncharacterized protein LOC105359382 [Ceratosolen solmsi marchali]
MKAAATGSSGGSTTRTTLGCIGKCTSGLTVEQLDFLTDHVQRTLGHAQGRKMLAEYLSQGKRDTDLRCLELYEKCAAYIDKERRYRLSTKEPRVEPLENDVNLALSAAEELDDVPEINLDLLEKYTDALANRSSDSMIDVLEETKYCLMNHLRQAHKGFRAYVMQPCPKS